MILFFNTILGTVNKKWLVQIIFNLGSWNELQDKPNQAKRKLQIDCAISHCRLYAYRQREASFRKLH
jgi:hypothetical protein